MLGTARYWLEGTANHRHLDGVLRQKTLEQKSIFHSSQTIRNIITVLHTAELWLNYNTIQV